MGARIQRKLILRSNMNSHFLVGNRFEDKLIFKMSGSIVIIVLKRNLCSTLKYTYLNAISYENY